MPSDDEIRQGQPPVAPAIHELLANIPDYDPRRRQIEEFQKQWMRMPPGHETAQARDNGPSPPHQP